MALEALERAVQRNVVGVPARVFTAEHLAAIVRQYEQRPVITSVGEPSRAAARQATATQLLNDIKVKPLRPRPRRAA